MQSIKLDFYTSHRQFYLADKTSPFDTGSDDFWTTEAFDSRLAVEEGILGVGTECYGPVKGVLQWHDREPPGNDFTAYDHVVEGSVKLPSGTLWVIACLDNEPFIEIALEPLTYRVRICSSNLASVIGDEGDDYYTLILWPEQHSERRVLKQYDPGY
jgi:hypothetical protein